MRSYSKTIIEGKKAKLTIAADAIRVKLPSAWTEEQRDRIEDFFQKVVANAPASDVTLRGEVDDPDRPRGSLRMLDWKHKNPISIKV